MKRIRKDVKNGHLVTKKHGWFIPATKLDDKIYGVYHKYNGVCHKYDIVSLWMQQFGKRGREEKDKMIDDIVSDPIMAKEMKKVTPITLVWSDGIIEKWGGEKK